MKRFLLILALVFAAAGVAGSAHAAGHGNLNLLLGTKTLDEDDWAPVEEQDAVGIHFDYTEEGWPMAFSVDLVTSDGSKNAIFVDDFGGEYYGSLNASTTELDFGIRKFFGDEADIAGFLGGGLGMISASAEIEFDGYRDTIDGSGLGLWIDGGITARVGNSLNVGFDIRISQGEVDMEGVDVEAGGTTVGFFIGYGW